MSIPDKYKFKYRIFASADIVGSTAFKSGRARQRQPWAHVFSGFFDEFPLELAGCFANMEQIGELTAKPSSCMDVWKLVGDEVLLVAEIAQHQDAAYHAIAFTQALNAYSDKLSRKHPELALKGTMWGAGFPVMNVEVVTQPNSSGKEARDFLGPSVDLGFRLAAHADRRRIPISADVALFLRHSRSASMKVANTLALLVDPPLYLKGIQAGDGYPMIWIDRLNGKATAEDKLLNRCRNRDQQDALLEYLEEQFLCGAIGLTKPFIESDGSVQLCKVPEDMRAWRDTLMKEDPDLKYSETSNQADPDPKAPVDSPPLPRSIERGH